MCIRDRKKLLSLSEQSRPKVPITITIIITITIYVTIWWWPSSWSPFSPSSLHSAPWMTLLSKCSAGGSKWKGSSLLQSRPPTSESPVCFSWKRFHWSSRSSVTGKFIFFPFPCPHYFGLSNTITTNLTSESRYKWKPFSRWTSLWSPAVSLAVPRRTGEARQGWLEIFNFDFKVR